MEFLSVAAYPLRTHSPCKKLQNVQIFWQQHNIQIKWGHSRFIEIQFYQIYYQTN